MAKKKQPEESVGQTGEYSEDDIAAAMALLTAAGRLPTGRRGPRTGALDMVTGIAEEDLDVLGGTVRAILEVGEVDEEAATELRKVARRIYYRAKKAFKATAEGRTGSLKSDEVEEDDQDEA